MEIQVYAKGRNQRYCAKGIFDGKRLQVLQGSKISSSIGAKITPIVDKIRNNPKLVSTDYIVLDDISFRSASTAASFVTGNISNGMRIWKLDSGRPLGTVMREDI